MLNSNDLYQGTIVEESLEDNRILNNFKILNVRITDDKNEKDRWHLYKAEGQKEEFKKLASVIKPVGWYAHFWNGNNIIAIFKDKIFEFYADDKNSYQPAVEYGLSVGISKEQLDFIIE